MSQITLRSKRRYGKDYREVVLDPSIPSDVKRRDTLLAAGWEVIHGETEDCGEIRDQGVHHGRTQGAWR
jgi:hypothetical protein